MSVIQTLREMSTRICEKCSKTYTSVKGSKVDIAKLCRPCYEKIREAEAATAIPLLKWIGTDE